MLTTVKDKKERESYWKQYWRPAMAWQYFFVCLFDFVFAPVLTGWYSVFTKVPYEVWKPITMADGGFYHISMGAIIGVTAWTRGQEKIERLITRQQDVQETEKA